MIEVLISVVTFYMDTAVNSYLAPLCVSC